MLSQTVNNQKKLRQVITKILKEELFSENKFLRRKLDTDDKMETDESEVEEYSRTLKNARQQGVGLRFPKSVIKNNPSRFRPYNREMVDESDPKVGSGKKPEGSGRRLYTDENPSDTVSVKFRTKEDIIDTLNKDSFKSKPHKRQSQIINLIHQRVRAAYQNAKDPETKKRLKRGLDYIEGKKEQSKQKTIRLQKEGLHDTSWENDEGNKITLIDLLNATEDIPVETISVEELKPHLLTWDGDEEEIKKIEKSDLQYPILIFVEDDGSFISIIDGHHRAQKAVRKGLETIKAKIIPINSLPKDIRKVFSYMGKQEEMKEGEITEKCWKGYTQKGMKTMFGKRYPNCVKKTLKEENYSRFFQRRDYCFNKFFDELENNKELIPEVSYQGGYYTFTIISIAFMLRYCEKNKEYTYNPELHDKIKKEYENRLMSIYRKHGFE